MSTSSRIRLFLLSVLALAGLMLWPAAPIGAADPKVNASEIDARVEKLIAENHIPGAAVTFVENGEVVYQRGYGEAAPGRPVTPQTQFYIGSLTKSFTALAVMQLVEQGKLELDAPVQRYLPWFAVADADASSRITVRHLLNQTSGLSPAGDPRASEYFPTLTDQVRALADVTPTAPVGSRFQYYNQNYRVLGFLVEQASGKPYGDYVRENVLGPLGMSRSAANPADAPDLAQGHGQAFGFPFPRPQESRPSALPSGYLITTAEDLGHYMVAMLDGARYDGRQVVRPESLALMQTPPAGANSQYGMGWMISNQAEGKIVFHDGALENYYSLIILIPERKLGLAILTNQYGVLQLMNGFRGLQSELGDILLDQPVTPLRSFTWIGLPVALVAGADLVNNLRRLWLLPKWSRDTARRRPWLAWPLALAELAVPLALLVGLPYLVSAALHEQGTWGVMYGVMPDLTGWVLVGLGFGIVRGAAKLAIVARRP